MVTIHVHGNITVDSNSTFSINNYASSQNDFTANDFFGTWIGISPHNNSNGQGITTKSVTLKSSGNHENIYYINGIIAWSANTNIGNNSSGSFVANDSESVLGLYTGNNNLILVEQKENGTYKGYLKKNNNNENILCLQLTQPGSSPVVSYMELTKSRTTEGFGEELFDVPDDEYDEGNDEYDDDDDEYDEGNDEYDEYDDDEYDEGNDEYDEYDDDEYDEGDGVGDGWY